MLITKEASAVEAQPKSEKSDSRLIESRQQPVWHVLVLTIATGKLYFFWWCYKTWRDVSSKLAQDPMPVDASFVERITPDAMASFRSVSPLLRTIGLFIPYWNNYLFLTLAMGAARLLPDKDSLPARRPLAAAALVVVAWATLSLLCMLPGAWFFLYLLAAVPVAVVQHWLNKYWRAHEQEGLLVRHGFSLGELAAIIAGSLYIGFLVSSFIMGASK